MKKLLLGSIWLLCMSALPKAILAAVTITETHSNANCYGTATGSIDIGISSGTAPFTYLWSDGAGTQDRTGLAAGSYSVTVTDNGGASASVVVSISEPPVINVLKAITNVYCGGANTGAIDLTVSGASPGYTYQWSDMDTSEDRNGLTAANYFVTITDNNGCVFVDSVNVTQPPGLVLSSAVTNVTCGSGANGAIDLTVQFGIPGYSYLWNDANTNEDRTGIAAGTYTVTVTDNSGCSSSMSATVGQTGGGMSINKTSTNPSCYGGSNGTITITNVIGSVAPYTFMWSDSAAIQNRTGMSAGSYTVTATSSTGCTASTTINLTEPTAISITLTPIQLTCFGSNNGAINTTVTGGSSPYTYNWGGGIFTKNRTGLASGNYTVTVTDFKGCTATQTTFVPQPFQLSVTTVASPQACTGGPTGSVMSSVTGGTTPYSYWWGMGITTPDLLNVFSGNYTVTVTDGNGCSATASSTVPTYTPMTLSNTHTDNLCFGSSTGSIQLTVTNGWAPYSYSWSTGDTTQNVSSLATGTYAVTVYDSHVCSVTGTVNISQPSFPMVVNAAVTDVSCFGESDGVININASNGAVPYSYNWGGGVITQNRTGLASGVYTVTVTDSNGCSASNSNNVSEPVQMMLSAVVTNAACSGTPNGAISVSVSGGFAPFTFLWSDGNINQNRTGLIQGNYSVTVSDNHSCSVSSAMTISGSAAIGLSAVVSPVSCNGGSDGAINLSVSGGTPPYSYNWDDGMNTPNRTGLNAGDYYLSVTDNTGCASSDSFTVIEPVTISVASVVTDVLCNGGATGTITLSLTGGNSPYSFYWDDGNVSQNRSGLNAGTYTVTVSDNTNCTVSHSATIQQSSSLSISTSVSQVLCFGGNNGAITTSVSGGTTPYTYDWGGGIYTANRTGLTVGSYQVTITDNAGCSAVAIETITQPWAINISGYITDASCAGASTGNIITVLSGGTSPYTIVWSTGATSQNINGLTAGSYELTATDINGCTANDTFSVAQSSSFTLTPTISTVTCNGGNTGAISIAATGGTAPYSYNWADGATLPNRSGLTAGTYALTVSDSAGCSANLVLAVTEPAALSVNTTVTNILCNGAGTGAISALATGGAGSYSYTWGGGITTANRTGLSAGSYSVTVTDANTCSAVANANITEPPVLSMNASITNVNCNGASTGAIDITVTGGATGYTYIWNNNFTTQDIAGVNAGVYAITVTDANGCSASVSSAITQPSTITVTYALTNATCNGANDGSISANTTGGSGSYTFNWSNGNNSPAINNIPAGNYSLSISDAANCATVLQFIVTEPQPITVIENHNHVSCNGLNNGNIDLSVSGAAFPYTYLWNDGAVTQDRTTLSPGNYRVTITDANSCSTAVNTISITQPPAISASTTKTNIKCSGTFTGAIDLTVSGGSAPYQYSWSDGAQTQDIGQLSVGNYSVTVSDANNCTSLATAVINDVQPLTTAITKTNVSCYGGNDGSIALQVSGGTPPYASNWNQGSTGGVLANLSAANYRVLVVDSNNCNAVDSAQITQPAQLAISQQIDDVACYGDANGSISITVSGGVPSYTYRWNTGHVNQNLSNLIRGAYSVTVTDANMCTASKLNMMVNEPQPILLTSSIVPVGCSNSQDGAVQLLVSGGVAPMEYLWSNGATSQNISGLASGNYLVTLTDQNGCSAVGDYVVGNSPPLSVNGIVKNTSCPTSENGSITLTVAGGTPGYTYNWSNGADEQNMTGLSTGALAVTITDSRNCTVSDSFQVAYDYDLTIDAGNSVTINLGEAVPLSATVNENHGNTFMWLPVSEVNCRSCQNTEAMPTANTHYTVQVVDENGCTASDTLTVTVNSITDIFIPNAFSPNHDGNNDVFQIYGDINTIAFLDLAIYNRWGEKVYETADHKFSWDGSYKGELVPPGAYIYTAKVVFINGYSRNDLKGSLTIIR